MAVVDPENLLFRINSGEEVTDRELADVAALLEETDEKSGRRSYDDIYLCLLVLGRAGARQYQPLLERFFDSRDPLTVELLLDILCVKWGGMGEQLERVLSFCLGTDWDPEEDVRRAALRIVGDYLTAELREGPPMKPSVKGVLQLLLSLFDEEALDGEVRRQVYLTLCRAGGKEDGELPSEFTPIDLNTGSAAVDWKMISELRHSSFSESSDS